MKSRSLTALSILLLAHPAACDADEASVAPTNVASSDGADASTVVPDVAAPAAFIASCSYQNTFGGTTDCKEYAGEWTEAEAEADCGAVFIGAAGIFARGACALTQETGRCVVGDIAVDGYVTVSGGDAGACDTAKLGCETFAGGTFTPSPVCDGGAACATPEPPTALTFQPPFQDCRAPLAGEPAGDSAGEVCTHTMISASTERGRYYPDYADCDVVRKQRPYYGAAADVAYDPEDSRLSDAEYMGELAWVTEQARASACTCCHDGSEAPEGAAVWDIDAGPLWIDTVSDEALAMMVGLTDSRYFGYYPAAENNGFDRSRTGLPTTDAERLKAFGAAEFERRGISPQEAADLPPFAPFFRELVEHRPEACADGVGVDAEGALQWSGASARYISVLRDGSASPGVQPNFDLPEGTLWAIAADHREPSLACGMTYGSVPSGAYQRYPAEGASPEPLISGETYYLHVQRDLAFPVTRCLFVAP